MKKPLIMLVDDIQEFLLTFEPNLRGRYGERYVVETYRSSEEIIGAIQGAKEEREEVALVIADHQMAGMKGVDLLIYLKDNHPEIKRLLLTGEAQAPDVMKGINTGAIQQYVRKEHMNDRDFDVFLSINNLLDTYGLESLAAAQKKTIEQIARDFHMQTLPSKMPEISGYSLAHAYSPLEVIGGDFFDVFKIDEQRYGLLVGDVSGHGSAAALLAKAIIDSIRTNAYDLSFPGKLLTHTNRLFLRYQDKVLIERLGSDSSFCTMVYCVLDFKQNILTFSSAGHYSPIVIGKDGSVSSLFKQEEDSACLGHPIGVAEMDYGEGTTVIAPRSRIVAYTDGVIEQESPTGQQFKGTLDEVLRANATLPVNDLLKAIWSAYDNHRGERLPTDDFTLLALGRGS